MITDKKWKELVTKMKTVGPVYQIPRRSKDRLTHFCDTCVPLLKGKRVLEIGCNAGIFGLCITEVSESYIGVEPGNKIAQKKSSTDYFKQALITLEEMNHQDEILNCTVKEFVKVSDRADFNALVMAYTLYHLSNKEVKLLQEKILPRCDLVIIQNREQPRKTKHNKYKFYKSRKVVKYFEKLGYEVQLVWGNDRGAKKAFSEVVCVHRKQIIEKVKKLHEAKKTSKEAGKDFSKMVRKSPVFKSGPDKIKPIKSRMIFKPTKKKANPPLRGIPEKMVVLDDKAVFESEPVPKELVAQNIDIEYSKEAIKGVEIKKNKIVHKKKAAKKNNHN